MFSTAKLYAAGAALIIILGLSATVYVQHGQKKVLRAELAQVRAANKTTDNAIQELKAEREKAGKSCAQQVAGKDRLIDELRRIRETKGGNDAKQGNGTSGNEVAAADSARSGDALLALLNGMFPTSAADGNGVCQAADPAVAGGAAVVPGQVRYFFCSDEDVRNLVSNVALCKAWALEAVDVIEGLR